MVEPMGDTLVGCLLDGRYQVVRLLGRGGMGAVYEGLHTRLGKRVAIKVLSPTLAADEVQRRRFLREAQAADRIRHPHVVEVLDFGDQPTAFFVMEYLEGEDLGHVLERERKLPWSRTSVILDQASAALAAAHAEGIIHRDVKPSNFFLVSRRDGADWVKVVDFGIAKIAGPVESTQLTASHAVMGTVAYMSPEQVLGHPVDARSDIYALGVVLYRMLTGSLPFAGTVTYHVLDQHIRTPPTPPRTLEPSIPPAVEQVVLKALAKSPDDRFESMEDLRIALLDLGDTRPWGAPGEAMRGRASTSVTKSVPPPTSRPSMRTPATPPQGSSPLTPQHVSRPVPQRHVSQPSLNVTTDPTVPYEETWLPRRRWPLWAGAFVAVTLGAGAAAWFLPAQPPDDRAPAASVDLPESASPPTAVVARSPHPEDDDPGSPGEPRRARGPSAEPPVAPPAAPTEAPSVDPEVEPVPAAAETPPAAAKAKGKRRREPDEPPSKPRPAAVRRAPSTTAVVAQLRQTAAKRCARSGFAGTVTVSFHVRPDGVTALVKAESPHHQSAAGACMVDLVKRAAFPAGSAGRHELTIRFDDTG